jgi:hypothetical protein
MIALWSSLSFFLGLILGANLATHVIEKAIERILQRLVVYTTSESDPKQKTPRRS